MRLTHKIGLILLVTIALSIGLNALVMWRGVLPQFEELDRQAALSNADRANQALQAELRFLSNQAADWALWTDTYEFMRGNDPSYVDSNLYADTLIQLDVNLLYLVNPEGEVVWGMTVNSDGEEAVIEELASDRLPDDHPFLRHNDTLSLISGFLKTSEHPLIFASSTILTNEKTGPAAGSLIMGRTIDPGRLMALQDQTNVSFEILPYGDRAVGGHLFAQIEQSKGAPLAIIDSPANRKSAAENSHTDTYQSVADSTGVPAYILHTSTDRQIYTAGHKTVLTAIALLGFAGILALSAMWAAVRLVAIKPLHQFARSIEKISDPDKFERPYEFRRNDEIGILCRQFDEMLDRISMGQEFRLENAFRSGVADLESRVTERTDELRDSREFIQLIADAAAANITYLDRQRVYQFVNKQFADTVGCKPEEMVGKPASFFQPDDMKKLVTPYLDTAFGGQDVTFERSRRGADGRLRTYQSTYKPHIDSSGVVVGVVGLSIDITELKQTASELKTKTRAEELLRKIAIAANQANHADEAIQASIDELCAYSGWPVGHAFLLDDELSGDLVPSKLWHLDDPKRFEPFRKATDNMTFQPGVGLPGNVASDIAPRWHTSVERDKEVARTQGTLRVSIADEVGLQTGFAIPVMAGSEVAAVLEFFTDQHVGRDDHLLSIAEQVGIMMGRVIERHRNERELMAAREEAMAAKDEIEVASRAKLEAERQLNQVQKMDAIGQLTGGIAHDFNNILMVTDGYTRRAIKNAGDADAVREALEEVLTGTEHAALLTKQLLSFSRRQILEKRVFRAEDAIENIKSLLRNSIGEQLELSVSFECDGACVETDMSELQQALLNLVINARDAMAGSGCVEIETTVVELHTEYTASYPTLDAGRYVEIAVKDQGAGIDPETAEHIFEPFFTTKDQGKGTGLGLAMVYGFANSSGGAVDLESTVGEGSTFRVYLPAVDRDPKAIVAEVEQDHVGNGETVLLVEDDPALLEIVRDMLETLGYSVLTASDGFEAIEAEAEHEGEIDLLLSDVVMPNMGGFEAAAIIRAERPDINIVFMSGYPNRAGISSEDIPERCEFLQKPVKPDHLARVIREQLDRPANMEDPFDSEDKVHEYA